MKLFNLLRGLSTVRICGDDPEECLNLLSEADIPFWNIRFEQTQVTLNIYSKDLNQVKDLCLSVCCDLRLQEERGFPPLLRKTVRRPILLFGLLIAFGACFFLQQYVWSVEILGDDPAVDRRILQLLQERGIAFGTKADDLDSQQIKLEMLRQLPELSWMAVNRRGGKLTVLYLLSSADSTQKKPLAANLVAVRDAVITDYTILEGMRLFSSGEAVRKGQLLVSGFEDYGLCLRGVAAEGEIYGETWHSGSLILPENRMKKTYTGRQWRQYVLILGRKRINLCGNSGISTTSCDKIIDEHVLRLPNLELPLRLQEICYREYILSPEAEDTEETRTRLEFAWEMITQKQMVAGTIVSTDAVFLRQEGYYVLHARSRCCEMIAMTVPMEGIYKGDIYE